MDVSPASFSLGGLAAAQMMFGVTAGAAAAVQSPDAVSGDAGASTPAGGSTGASVAVLRMALENERRLVDVFA